MPEPKFASSKKAAVPARPPGSNLLEKDPSNSGIGKQERIMGLVFVVHAAAPRCHCTCTSGTCARRELCYRRCPHKSCNSVTNKYDELQKRRFDVNQIVAAHLCESTKPQQMRGELTAKDASKKKRSAHLPLPTAATFFELPWLCGGRHWASAQV